MNVRIVLIFGLFPDDLFDFLNHYKWAYIEATLGAAAT